MTANPCDPITEEGLTALADLSAYADLEAYERSCRQAVRQAIRQAEAQ